MKYVRAELTQQVDALQALAGSQKQIPHCARNDNVHHSELAVRTKKLPAPSVEDAGNLG